MPTDNRSELESTYGNDSHLQAPRRTDHCPAALARWTEVDQQATFCTECTGKPISRSRVGAGARLFWIDLNLGHHSRIFVVQHVAMENKRAGDFGIAEIHP